MNTPTQTIHPPITPTPGGAIPAALRSEWIKLSTLRSNRAILGLTVAIDAFASWAVATLVTDEVLTASQVFTYPVLLTAVLSAIAAIILFSSEAQHGTLAIAFTAQPARGVLALSKTVTAAAVGLALGAVGLAAGFAGALAGGLAVGDSSAIAGRTAWALLYTALAAVIGLGVGMIARRSAGAIAGLLVWWFVAENLIVAFAPARVARFLPFNAGYRLLDVGSDLDTPEMLRVALTRPQYGLVFGAYALATLGLGIVLVGRRDTD